MTGVKGRTAGRAFIFVWRWQLRFRQETWRNIVYDTGPLNTLNSLTLSLPLVQLSTFKWHLLEHDESYHKWRKTDEQTYFHIASLAHLPNFSSWPLIASQCTGWRSIRPTQRWSSRLRSGSLSSGASSSFWASLAWWSGGRDSTVNLPADSHLSSSTSHTSHVIAEKAQQKLTTLIVALCFLSSPVSQN